MRIAALLFAVLLFGVAPVASTQEPTGCLAPGSVLDDVRERAPGMEPRMIGHLTGEQAGAFLALLFAYSPPPADAADADEIVALAFDAKGKESFGWVYLFKDGCWVKSWGNYYMRPRIEEWIKQALGAPS